MANSWVTTAVIDFWNSSLAPGMSTSGCYNPEHSRIPLNVRFFTNFRLNSCTLNHTKIQLYYLMQKLLAWLHITPKQWILLYVSHVECQHPLMTSGARPLENSLQQLVCILKVATSTWSVDFQKTLTSNSSWRFERAWKSPVHVLICNIFCIVSKFFDESIVHIFFSNWSNLVKNGNLGILNS